MCISFTGESFSILDLDHLGSRQSWTIIMEVE